MVTKGGLGTFWRRRFGDDYLAQAFDAELVGRWDVLTLGYFGASQCRQVFVMKIGHRKVGQSKNG